MKKWRPWISWLLAAAVAAGSLLYVNEAPQLSRYSCTLPGLGAAYDGYTIVHVSDVHGTVLGKGNRRLLKAVAEQKPDLIAVTGDLVHRDDQMADAETLIKGLCAIAPVYYVTGNHEWAAGLALNVKAMVEACGGTALSNTYVVAERGGQNLVIAGCDDPNGYADQKTPQALLSEIEAEHPEVPVVLLYHRNQWLETLTGADLVLCGHGHGVPIGIHGGQLAWDRYRSGLYQVEGTTVCVSRGLGHSVPPMRLIRAHLPVITLETR